MNRSQLKRRAYYRFPPMAERIQLKEPGSSREMFVAGVTPEVVERNEYYLFQNATAMGGSWEMLVPQSSVKAQFERLGISSVEQMIGKSVRFGRSTKMSRANKPFWDIDWAAGNGTIPPATPTVRAPANTDGTHPPGEEKPRLDRLYLRATRLVLDEVVPLYTKAGIGCSDTAVAAMAATLFIAATKVEN